MQQLLISDANILIDMEEEHACLPDLGLVLKEVSSESMIYAMQLTETYTQASRNDCFALALAKQEQCPLLTGDMALRKAAEREATTVKGTIWLVTQLVVHQKITTEQAQNAYNQMKANGRRLPWTIAEQELEKQKDSPRFSR